MEKLTYDVMRVMLKLPQGQQIPFKAGQYINIILDDGQRRAFSFANPPHQPDLIELQIRLMPGGRFTTHVFEGMKEERCRALRRPAGRFLAARIRASDRLRRRCHGLRAGQEHGRGCLPSRPQAPDLPVLGRAQTGRSVPAGPAATMGRDHENFHFIPVLSDAAPEDNWQGRTGLVHEAILADFPDLAGKEIYACGSVKMVEAIFPSLKTQGAEEGMCFSDAFTVSARSMAFQPKG
jgi:CDP-4-dehydro-6-deoxyglucose reductase